MQKYFCANYFASCAVILALAATAAADPGTAFQYQGRLTSNGAPVSGVVGLRFSLHTADTGGSQVGSALSFPSVSVSGGLFTQQLDFGAVYNGAPLFLNIEVDGNGGVDNLTPLSPRRPLSPAPYSVYSEAPIPSQLNANDGSPQGALRVEENGMLSTIGEGIKVGLSGIAHIQEGNFEFAVRQTVPFVTQDILNSSTIQPYYWQSFTMIANCELAAIDIHCTGAAPAATVTVRSGTGASGTILGQTAFTPRAGWNTAAFNTKIPMTTGSVYTFEVSANPSPGFSLSNTNPYAGGVCNLAAGVDARFRVLVFQTADYFPGLSIDTLAGIVKMPSGFDSGYSSSIDGTTFTVDADNNRVGIGTSSPTTSLDARGSARFDVSTLVVNDVTNRVGVNTPLPSQTLDVEGNAVVDGGTFFVDASNNRVGMGTSTPSTTLHAVGSRDGTGTVPLDTVGFFHNTSTGNSPDVLLLQIGTTGNPGVGCNFITFADGDGAGVSLGSIQGNGAGSVELAASGNDYAEWLPMIDEKEFLEPGDVVGVHRGRITRNTAGASAVMVLSTNPIVTGNAPAREGDDKKGRRVAFVGQALVKVKGAVAEGDLLVPSGFNDGVAIAIREELVSPGQMAGVIGRAWESSQAAGVKQINALVGLPQSATVSAALMREIRVRDERLEVIEKRLEALEGHSSEAPSSSFSSAPFSIPYSSNLR